MKRSFFRGARSNKFDTHSPPTSHARARDAAQQKCWSVIGALLFCSSFALNSLTLAEPRYRDYVDSKVKRLLLRTELALASGQLFAPPFDNALLYLERVIGEQPANPRAAELLKQLLARYAASNAAMSTSQELARMNYLKFLSDKARGDERLIRRLLRPALAELRDCHVSLGLASLQLGELAEAGRQQRAAVRLTARYELERGGLSYFSRQLEQDKSARAAYAWKRYAEQTYRPTRARERLVGKYLRPELERLKDCRVSLGLAALQLGDPAEAGNQHQVAADLVTRYKLEETGLKYLAQLVEHAVSPRGADGKAPSRARAAPALTPQDSSPQSSPPRKPPRVFGTF